MAIGIDTSFMVAFEDGDHPSHGEVRAFISRELAKKNTFALCPQVLSEFIHVVTDAKRFPNPMSVEEAISRSERLWNTKETRQVFPDDDATALFLHWMRIHRLGRKRILDTQIAALYYSANVKEIATTDSRDFRVFDVFEIHAF